MVGSIVAPHCKGHLLFAALRLYPHKSQAEDKYGGANKLNGT